MTDLFSWDRVRTYWRPVGSAKLVRWHAYRARHGVFYALTTTPRPHARGTYIRSWRVIQVSSGAVIANTADLAYPEPRRLA